MKAGTWKVALCLTAAVGAIIGYRLSGLPNLQPYRLLNVIGLLYSLLGVFVLSEAFVSSPSWKTICVERIAPILLWAHITVPVGAVVGGALAWLLGRGPSAHVVLPVAVANSGYVMIVGSILENVVVRPGLFKHDVESRWRRFGLFLLATGLMLQTVSAISEL